MTAFVSVKRAALGSLRRTAPAALGLLFVAMVWVVLSTAGGIGKTLLASPAEVWVAVERAFAPDATVDQKFHYHAWHTLGRALGGWVTAGILGVFSGLVLGRALLLFNVSLPVVEFFRAIPPILAFPLFLVAYDYGEAAYRLTVIFGCLPIMLLTVARGTSRISRDRAEVLKIHGASLVVRLFSSGMEVLPSVFLGARVTFSISLVIAVVCEMVFTPRNGLAIGSLARDAEIAFDTPVFYACVLTIGLFGYIGNLLLRRLEELTGGSPALKS